MALPAIDLGGMIRGAADRVRLLVTADRTAMEMLDIIRDTHRILLKMETIVDRLDAASAEWQRKLSAVDLSGDRVRRLEDAVLNIERATSGVEAAMNALPRALRQRIFKET